MGSLLGTWPTTQACALTGNRTSDCLAVVGGHSIHWATPARAKLYFIDYAITVPISPFVPLYPALPRPSGNPPTIVHVHGKCICLPCLLPSLLYFTSPWLFCNYRFVLLNHLTSSPTPPHPLPSGNYKNTLHINDSLSVLLVCLVCFLD